MVRHIQAPEDKDGIVSRYHFDESALDVLKVLRFSAYSEDRLDFILTCRSGKGTYDIVEGGVANDKVFHMVEIILYMVEAHTCN